MNVKADLKFCENGGGGGGSQVWPGIGGVEGWGLVDREGVGWQQCLG